MMRNRLLSLLLVTITLLVLVAAVAGCMEYGADGKLRVASAPITTTFCKAAPQTPAGTADRCEDFAAVAQGNLPAGWIGGDGMIVQPSARFRGVPVLTSFEPRAEYSVLIPWRFGGDYRVDLSLFACQGGRVSLAVGQATLAIEPEFYPTPARIRLGESVRDLPDMLASGHFISLIRTGSVYKVMYDLQQVLLARYDNPGDVDGLAFKSTCARFGVVGVRVAGAGAAASDAGPLGAPLAGPTVTLTGLCEAKHALENDMGEVFSIEVKQGKVTKATYLRSRPEGMEQGTSNEPAILADGQWVQFRLKVVTPTTIASGSPPDDRAFRARVMGTAFEVEDIEAHGRCRWTAGRPVQPPAEVGDLDHLEKATATPMKPATANPDVGKNGSCYARIDCAPGVRTPPRVRQGEVEGRGRRHVGPAGRRTW